MCITRARRRQRRKAQTLQVARAADVPGIGNDEAAGFVKLAERFAFLSGRGSGHDALVLGKVILANSSVRSQSATAPVAMTTVRTMKPDSLVIIAGHRFLRDPLIFYSWSQDHAVGKLIDHGALNFLPGRLTRRILIAVALVQCRAARCQLGGGNQNIGAAFVEINAHPIAGLEQSETPSRRRFRRSVEDRRRA